MCEMTESSALPGFFRPRTTFLGPLAGHATSAKTPPLTGFVSKPTAGCGDPPPEMNPSTATSSGVLSSPQDAPAVTSTQPLKDKEPFVCCKPEGSTSKTIVAAGSAPPPPPPPPP